MKAEEEIELKTFEHNIVMNNREHIPNAARDIVVEINQLFDSTEELVLTILERVIQENDHQFYLVVQLII